jgi:hypothetical protein
MFFSYDERKEARSFVEASEALLWSLRFSKGATREEMILVLSCISRLSYVLLVDDDR